MNVNFKRIGIISLRLCIMTPLYTIGLLGAYADELADGLDIILPRVDYEKTK